MLIVVEGKNDKNKLENIFKDANIIITNGSEISQDTLNTIKSLSENNEVVLCLDPDGPGEKIRKKIMEYIPNAYNVYADKQKAISRNKKKVGIEHMSKKDICELFEHIYVPKYENNISYEELFDLGLMNNKKLREKLCTNLHIGYCNGKQLYKRLNMLGLDIETIKENIKWLSMKQKEY